MKKIALLFLCLASFLYGCQVVDIVDQNDMGQQMKTVILSADMGTVDTKASIDSETGAFAWQDGDVISVLATDNKFYDFTLKTGAGEFKAEFEGEIPTGANVTTVASYPSVTANGTENTLLSETTFNFVLPSEWTWKKDVSNVPMVAYFNEGSDKMSFRQVGGILRFPVKNMPANGSFVLTMTDLDITGEFPVDLTNLGESAMVAGTTGGSTLTINYSSVVDGDNVEFNVPVPTGVYTNFKLEIKDQSGNVLFEKKYVKNNEIQRAFILNMSAIQVPSRPLAAPATVWPYFVDARVIVPSEEGVSQYAAYVDDATEPQICNVETVDGKSTILVGGDFDHNTTHTVAIAKVVDGVVLTTTKSPASASFKTGRVMQMTYNTGTRFVCAAWDDVALGVENSTVYDEATQKWSMVPQKDPSSRSYRGYRVRLYDENMTLLYEEVPFSSQVDYGGGMSDSSWIGKVGGKNVLLPTSLTFGWLEPGKTYYFQVQTLSEPVEFTNDLTSKNRCFEAECAGHTITSARGGSAWSKLTPMTTDAAHVPAANEVFYEGFDDMMFNSDIMNMSVALVPEFLTETGQTYKSTASAALYKAWVAKPFSERRFSEQGFNTMLGVFYHGLTDKEKQEPTLKTEFNEYAGSLEGWSVVSSAGNLNKGDDYTRTMNPRFGAVTLGQSGTNGDYVTLRSTKIYHEKLSESGTKCKITVKVSGQATTNDSPMATVAVKRYGIGGGASQNLATVDFSSTQNNSWTDDKNYVHYPTYSTIELEATLYAGDEIGFEKPKKANTASKKEVGCLTIGELLIEVIE